ncbi:hypothetical protein TrVGV298_003983 [Trichoderma virens]|nr:hypothetical protein TrVGV298_003983 [Trichoderma virens]
MVDGISAQVGGLCWDVALLCMLRPLHRMLLFFLFLFCFLPPYCTVLDSKHNPGRLSPFTALLLLAHPPLFRSLIPMSPSHAISVLTARPSSFPSIPKIPSFQRTNTGSAYPLKRKGRGQKVPTTFFSPASPTPFAAMWPRQDMVDYAYKYANKPPMSVQPLS